MGERGDEAVGDGGMKDAFLRMWWCGCFAEMGDGEGGEEGKGEEVKVDEPGDEKVEGEIISKKLEADDEVRPCPSKSLSFPSLPEGPLPASSSSPLSMSTLSPLSPSSGQSEAEEGEEDKERRRGWGAERARCTRGAEENESERPMRVGFTEKDRIQLGEVGSSGYDDARCRRDS